MDKKKHILIVEDELELALSTIHFLQDKTCAMKISDFHHGWVSF